MIKQLEKIYPEGSNLTILNTFYQRPVWVDGKMVQDDFIILNYINTDTMKKDHIIINNPDYIYYILKDKYETPDYNRFFIERDKVDPVCVPFKNLLSSIADNTNNTQFYKTNLANRDREANNKLHTNTRIFFSDVNVEDHYRFRFANTYTNEICSLSKGFFDIEVDGKFAKGDFVKLGECEINCVSYLDQKTSTVYTFILRNMDNPLISEFEDEISSGKFGFDGIKEFIINAVGGIKQATKYGVDNFKYNILFFDKEIELIKSLFDTIHKCSPDFCLTWNGSSFDIPYIIERIVELGYNPHDIMCDQRYEYKLVKNYVDERNRNDLPERGDFTYISGDVVFIDQMIQYASRRKAKFGSINSFKLDDIGLREAKVQKLDYSYITKSVLELPWLDFKTFTLYNIMDTVVQYCIEQQTQDIEYIFTKCVINNTIYRKGHRQTTYLINRIASDFYKDGFIIGNNKNRWNSEPPKFAGALVGDPTNTNDYSKLKINGRAIWICDNLMDFDFSSLYPSVMLEFNIAPNTQIGKIIIPEQVYDHENVYHQEHYSRGGEFIENLVSDSIIEFCKRWLHLAGFKEMLEDINEYYNRYNTIGTYQDMYNSNSALVPVIGGVVSALEFSNRYNEVPDALVFFNEPRPIDMNYESLQGVL